MEACPWTASSCASRALPWSECSGLDHRAARAPACRKEEEHGGARAISGLTWKPQISFMLTIHWQEVGHRPPCKEAGK